MNVTQPSKQSAYKLGRFLGVASIGCMFYAAYGLIYWLATGDMYFGPWEWGVCLLTAAYMGLIMQMVPDVSEQGKVIKFPVIKDKE